MGSEIRRPGLTGSWHPARRRLGGSYFRLHFSLVFLIAAFWFGFSRHAAAYSVLTHEEIVDILWKDEIKPLLLKRYPTATDAELRKAQAYTYGGCLIQDLGYYPFGNRFFSDLVHYVRSGDFVKNLFEESTNLNEYAFAVGALAHYASDNTGHPTVNRVVAMTFPDLRRKYGNRVTYADDPKAHIRVEFGFDLVQVAKNRYSSEAYHQFIGFEVAKPLLERAFLKTYDIQLENVIGHIDLAIGTFRRGVSEIIPEMTHVALEWKRADLVKEIPNFSAHQFRYNLSRSSYEREWGREYRKPRFMTRVLAFCLRWVPKVGPFKALKFVIPTPETEDLYIKSVNLTVERYRGLLHDVGSGDFHLADMDFDTGQTAKVGEYELADWAYARLLQDLEPKGFEHVSPELRTNVLAFYRGLDVPPPTKKQAEAWRDALNELQKLRDKPAQPGLPKAEVRGRKEIPGSKQLRSPKAQASISAAEE
jgi:hypothetical protein